MGTKTKSRRYQQDINTTPRNIREKNLTTNLAGNPKYPVALADAHITETIDKQSKLTAEQWRALAWVLVNRAKKYALSFSKVDASAMHHIIQSAGIAHDKAYGRELDTHRAPSQVLIQLFSNSGAGEAIARNLTAMIPKATATVIDAQPTTDSVSSISNIVRREITDDTQPVSIVKRLNTVDTPDTQQAGGGGETTST